MMSWGSVGALPGLICYDPHDLTKMSRVARPAKYSQYPKIIAIFLVSSYSVPNQTKLRILCSQKSFQYYIG